MLHGQAKHFCDGPKAVRLHPGSASEKLSSRPQPPALVDTDSELVLPRPSTYDPKKF
jgi:hypothetical protein